MDKTEMRGLYSAGLLGDALYPLRIKFVVLLFLGRAKLLMDKYNIIIVFIGFCSSFDFLQNSQILDLSVFLLRRFLFAEVIAPSQ